MRGVRLRRAGLTKEQAAEAEGLYAEGQSLATVAASLDVDPGIVRNRLLERGAKGEGGGTWDGAHISHR